MAANPLQAFCISSLINVQNLENTTGKLTIGIIDINSSVITAITIEKPIGISPERASSVLADSTMSEQDENLRSFTFDDRPLEHFRIKEKF